jgi:hypothetical protein
MWGGDAEVRLTGNRKLRHLYFPGLQKTVIKSNLYKQLRPQTIAKLNPFNVAEFLPMSKTMSE